MRIALGILAILMVNAMRMKVEGAFPDTVPSHLICYSKINLKGETISVVDNVRDLVNDLNFTISSCSVTGIWIFYNSTGFKGKINAFYGQDSSIVPSISGNISSIRKVESNHKIVNELVLFENPLFKMAKACNVLGAQTFIDLPIHCRFARSAVVKGFADWTIHSVVGRSISRISACLKANRNGAAFFAKLDSNSIGPVLSIEQGCKGRVFVGEAEITDQDKLIAEPPPGCGCNVKGVLNGDTSCKDGKCKCNAAKHFTGPKCYKCEKGFYMKDDECIHCQCNSAASDGCDKNGDCKCKDPSITGRKCDTKTIVLKNFNQKLLTVKCSVKCGSFSLQVKVTNNKNGMLQLAVGNIPLSPHCLEYITKEGKCEGVESSDKLKVNLAKWGPSFTVSLSITTTNLLDFV